MSNEELTLNQLSEVAGGASRDWSGICIERISLPYYLRFSLPKEIEIPIL